MLKLCSGVSLVVQPCLSGELESILHNGYDPLHETIWLVLLMNQGTWRKIPLAMTAQILAQAALAQEQSTSTEIVGCLLLSGCTNFKR